MLRNRGRGNRLFSFFEQVFGYWIVGIFLLFSTFSVATEIVLRKLFSASLFGVEECIGLLMISITFLPTSVIQKADGHVKMNLLIEKLRPKFRTGIEIVGGIFSLIAFAVITYGGTVYIIGIYQRGEITVLREWPTWPFFMVLPLGIFLVSLRLCIQMYCKLKQDAPQKEQQPQLDEGGMRISKGSE